ncbi:hypothetical protein [Pseudomonas mosselii]|uniref:hypothetical protein n=1 Tax=Pseudomonas mosselii TaxID=78327 RepID=UPI002174DF55|nr:hypothetical protein [Pseudomonas mosselii]
MQVETPEVGAQKANTPRYDTLVIRSASGKTVPREVDGGEVVSWSQGHALAAMDALEVFVDDLADGSYDGLAQGAADALNLMRRRRALGWDADVVAEEPPANWRTAVSRAEATAREVFGVTDENAMQAIDYMAGLLLAFEPAEQSAPVERDERAAFEAAWGKLHKHEGKSPFQRIEPLGNYRWGDVHEGWLMWQARGALERNP